MWFANGDGLREYAVALMSEGPSPNSRYHASYVEISRSAPLPAVIRCASGAQAITLHRARQLEMLSDTADFADLVGPKDTVVLDPDDMRSVPPGAFIAFIQVDPPIQSPRSGRRRKGRRHLIHVMLSLGRGYAVGTQGGNVGLPVSDGWQQVDLARSLLWNVVPGTYDSIAESLGQGSPRHLRIRYRKIEYFQNDQPTWPEEETAVPDNQRVLATGRCAIIQPMEVWYVGNLADCVAVAAIKPAGSLDKPAVNKQIFIYHSNGGYVNMQQAPVQQLLTFLGQGDADWVFVHGASSKTNRSIEQFNNQPFFDEIVDGRNVLGNPHIVKQFSGSSLQIDSNAEIVNITKLTSLSDLSH